MPQSATLILINIFVLASSIAAAVLPIRPQSPPPVSCTIHADQAVPVTPAPGRTIYCGLDLGSKTAKLSVVSMVRGQGTSIKDERQCKRSLGMGALVFDATTKTARALPEDAIVALADTVKEFQKICAVDRGTVVAAGATQWARDATNIADVRTRVSATTGLMFDVLTPTQEADYGYIAASAGTPERIVLDPGSNSFQISWQPRGSTTITSVLVPYGYVRAAAGDFEAAPTYEAGRTSYQANARRQIEDALGKLNPRMSVAALKALIADGKVGSDLITLGQDGAAYLYARGSLRLPGGGWIADANGLNAVIVKQTPTMDTSFGLMGGAPLSAAEIQTYFKSLGPADFKTLTTEPVRSLYGQRTLVVPALVDLLMRELGVKRLIMVPQELSSGFIISRVH